VLDDGRPGHRSQGIGIAEKLAAPYQIKNLRFTRLDRLSNRLLGATRTSLDRARSDSLEPPWPDLVISPGRRTVPIARWIGKRGRGRTRLVQLGRKGGYVAKYFDLVVSLAHFHHSPHPRRIELTLPLHKASQERLARAAARWPDLFGSAPSPHFVLLVGGSSLDFRLDAATAQRLAEQLRTRVETATGSLFVVTSRRTGAEATAALRRGLGATGRLHEWQPSERDSPYLAYLARADVIVVTGDSESMLAEAAATRKPLYIYPLPERQGSLKSRFKRWAHARATARSGNRSHRPRRDRLLGRLCAWLFRSGILRAPRDPKAFHRALVRDAIARPYDAPAEGKPWNPARPNDDVVVRAIRALMVD
jgi:mitochondrial fission protein ELM1